MTCCETKGVRKINNVFEVVEIYIGYGVTVNIAASHR